MKFNILDELGEEEQHNINKPTEVEIKQTNELAEAMHKLNSDDVSKEAFTEIDMKSNLSDMEITSILILDTWVGFGALPLECSNLTRRRKRLNVSKLGLGRQQLVDMAVADRDKKMPDNKGFLNKLLGTPQKV